MTSNKSLMYRVGVGKAIGFIIGLMGFVVLPILVHEPSMLLRIGILFWYPTLGAIIGMFGAFAHHPVLNFPLPWWLRGALVGGWMNLLLTLFAYDQIGTLIMAIFGEYSQYVSPFSMVLEGALIGVMMDYFLTSWFGDGWSDKPNS